MHNFIYMHPNEFKGKTESFLMYVF